jgi:hypothetical protein
MMNKKCQLDIKGMTIKYTLSVFFIAVVVVSLSFLGVIGNVTPSGGVKDFGVIGQGITAAAVVEQNASDNVNDTVSEGAEEDS